MKITALLDAATATQQYASDCDTSSFIGKPVTINSNKGPRVGTVLRAWIKDGDLYAEIEIEASGNAL